MKSTSTRRGFGLLAALGALFAGSPAAKASVRTNTNVPSGAVNRLIGADPTSHQFKPTCSPKEYGTSNYCRIQSRKNKLRACGLGGSKQ